MKMPQENPNRDYKGTMIFGIALMGVVAVRGLLITGVYPTYSSILPC